MPRPSTARAPCSGARSTRPPRGRWASPRRPPTTSTGTTKYASRSRNARRCRPTRSPASRRTCASPAARPWRRASSGASPPGRTGSSAGRTPWAKRARSRCTARVRRPPSTGTASRKIVSSIDYATRIPNNVDLAGDRALQRALEHWQPNFIEWWRAMGPEGSLDFDVYLRTATSVESDGWAHFGYVKMPDYRWGIFLAPAAAGRKIHFGDHLGEDAWQDVPGEHRANLRRIIVTQGDTEPASVEQQRHLGLTAPSMYDLRNLFQMTDDASRHLGAP